jgi:cytochrome P450
MTDRQLRDEVMTMFLAGHETTANGLAWTWHLLGRHAEVQERVQAEVADVFGGGLPTAADLPRLEFCERVIRESMRLYPPAFVVGRQAAEDFHLGEHFIPARTNVLASQWVVQRDPRWFDRPADFLPDRWADGLVMRLPKYAYFPFGGGPRVCIGNVFAMSEAILILALVVQRFRFTPTDDEPTLPQPAVTLRPGRPIEMHLHKR